MFIVSACLAGLNTRYDGESRPNKEVIDLVKKGEALPVCPEQLGGLPTPRKRSEIENGNGEDVLDGKTKVISEEGRDVTSNFICGAQETLKIAKLVGAKEALLKSNSPACSGVTAALLKRNGIKVKRTDGQKRIFRMFTGILQMALFFLTRFELKLI